MEFALQVASGQVRQDHQSGGGIEAIVRQCVAAEELGFSVAFVPDHYAFEAMGAVQRNVPAYEMFFVMATLAQRTTRIRIGSHVACMLFRHPAMHARLFAQIDQASGGRVIAGVGAGWTQAEFEMMGIAFPPVSERLRIMDEAVTVMRGLWTHESFSFEGEYFRLQDAFVLPKPVQTQGPPIMIGGNGKGVLRRAGQWADIVHLIPGLGAPGTTTLEAVRAFSDEALGRKIAAVREAELAAGRAPGAVKLATTIFTYASTDSPVATRKRAESLVGVFGATADEVLRHPDVLLGTPDEMEAELRRRQSAHGMELVAVNFADTAQIEAFGREVIPRFSRA
jgi:probable F420-dependent oxidoreductase